MQRAVRQFTWSAAVLAALIGEVAASAQSPDTVYTRHDSTFRRDSIGPTRDDTVQLRRDPTYTATGTVTTTTATTTSSAPDSTGGAPLKLGVMGGWTFPVSSTADAFKTGFNVGALLDINWANKPVGLRIDGSYNRLPFTDDVSEHLEAFGGDLNLLFQIPTGGGTVRPYITGGIGVYRVKFNPNPQSNPVAPGGPFDFTGSETRFALNGGGGLRFDFRGFGTFIEARYLNIYTSGTSVKLVPLMIGLEFGGR